ncbi:MAG TPA: sugar ABC transporter substrate-binding protein [Caldilineaceae bacterium]|nr:sugar ABC transporter substrate-binding protein [Caldilineaceae bacterium]
MKTQPFSRRAFLRLTGSALGVGLLAACAPPPGQAPAASNAEAGAAPAQEPITIRYGRHDPGLGTNVTIDAFQEEHPNIKIAMEQIGEFPTKIPALAAAGTLPDVVRSWEAMLFEMVRGGQFIDLQPFIDVEPEFHAEDFYEAVYNYPVVDGKRYGINDVIATHVTYYNVDLFDQHEVEYPDPQNFTWDDFEQKARAISDPDNQIWGSETIPVGWHYFTLKQVWQNNGDFFSADYKSCTIDQTATIEAVQFWADLLLDGNIMPSPSQIIGIGGAGAAAELMGAGKIGMQRMGSWITTDLVNNKIKFNIVPEPKKERLATIAHGGLNAVTSTSPHQQEAWMWINYNCSTQGIYNYAAQGRFPAARRSTNEIEPHTWVADVDFDVNWDVVLESTEYAYMLPGPCNEGEVLKVIGDALEKIYNGDAKAADLFPEITPKVNEILADCESVAGLGCLAV